MFFPVVAIDMFGVERLKLKGVGINQQCCCQPIRQ